MRHVLLPRTTQENTCLGTCQAGFQNKITLTKTITITTINKCIISLPFFSGDGIRVHDRGVNSESSSLHTGGISKSGIPLVISQRIIAIVSDACNFKMRQARNELCVRHSRATCPERNFNKQSNCHQNLKHKKDENTDAFFLDTFVFFFFFLQAHSK